VHTLSDPVIERYQARYTDMQDTLPGKDHGWVTGLREEAFATFRKTGLPTRRIETWKYTDLRSLHQAGFTMGSPNTVSAAEIAPYLVDDAFIAVFVDGRFSSDLSRLDGLQAGFETESLSQVLAAGDQACCEEMGNVVDTNQPGTAALNTALMQDGAIVRVADGVAVTLPLQLVFVSTAGSTDETHLRNLVVLGENSQATVLQSYVSIGASAVFCDVVTEVKLGQGANLRHVVQQDQSTSAWHLGLLSARLERDATMDSFVLSTGARLSRNEIRVVLDGEGAECTLNGVALVRGRQHCDNTTDIDHASARCHSSQTYKNVLDDRARSVFQGRIHVAQDSQKTDAHQMNRNLLLSRNAQADSKPELIIHADDVKCSHGATVGDLDQEAMFYLQSRGIDPVAARNLMVRGFAAEMIDDLPDDGIRASLEQSIAFWLEGLAMEEEAA
jgi:Fe-S cluster assembly protein SufD